MERGSTEIPAGGKRKLTKVSLLSCDFPHFFPLAGRRGRNFGVGMAHKIISGHTTVTHAGIAILRRCRIGVREDNVSDQ
jgi:hypothetical protein